MLLLFPKIIKFLGYDPMRKDSETLGEKVLEFRLSRGVNQMQLARRLGIDPTTLSRLERNQGSSLPAVLNRVSAFLICHNSGEHIPGV